MIYSLKKCLLPCQKSELKNCKQLKLYSIKSVWDVHHDRFGFGLLQRFAFYLYTKKPGVAQINDTEAVFKLFLLY